MLMHFLWCVPSHSLRGFFCVGLKIFLLSHRYAHRLHSGLFVVLLLRMGRQLILEWFLHIWDCVLVLEFRRRSQCCLCLEYWETYEFTIETTFLCNIEIICYAYNCVVNNSSIATITSEYANNY